MIRGLLWSKDGLRRLKVDAVVVVVVVVVMLMLSLK